MLGRGSEDNCFIVSYLGGDVEYNSCRREDGSIIGYVDINLGDGLSELRISNVRYSFYYKWFFFVLSLMEFFDIVICYIDCFFYIFR